MSDPNWTQAEATRALNRLLPRLRSELATAQAADPTGWLGFEARLQHEWPRLFALLLHLYGQRYDCFYHLDQILLATGRAWATRPADLRALDARRETEPHWFQHQRMLGVMLYVDLFANDLDGLRKRLPYVKQLSVTYLHLMPLFRAPEGNSDGGYAVSNYRAVAPQPGHDDPTQ